MSIDTIYSRLLGGVALAGNDAGIRVTTSYQPAAGPGSKVAPPTFPKGNTEPGSKYLLEKRYDADGAARDTVALDTVASQSNRCEEAILDACEAGTLAVPYLDLRCEIDGRQIRIPSLVAPHRSPDAYFRDSQTPDGTAFDDSEVGSALRRAEHRTARALFEYVPTDLVFGVWDSHRGGRGLRLARAYSSETIGWDPHHGERATVRTDPMNVPSKIKIAEREGDPDAWEVVGDGKLDKGLKATKPSEIGYGSVPAVSEGAGGVAISSAERIGYVSFAALARLSFPTDGAAPNPEVDAAGRAALAALALVGDRLAFAGPSIFLRSGCELVLQSENCVWIGAGGVAESVELDRAASRALLDHAVEQATSAGLRWADAPIALIPQSNLEALLTEALATSGSNED